MLNMISFCQVNLNFYLNSIKYYSHGEKFKGDFFFLKVSSLLKNQQIKNQKKNRKPLCTWMCVIFYTLKIFLTSLQFFTVL